MVRNILLNIYLKGLCHRHSYMNCWYDKAYDEAPTLSISIKIARTKNIRLYCGQQRGTSNPVSCDIAPLEREKKRKKTFLLTSAAKPRVLCCVDYTPNVIILIAWHIHVRQGGQHVTCKWPQAFLSVVHATPATLRQELNG